MEDIEKFEEDEDKEEEYSRMKHQKEIENWIGEVKLPELEGNNLNHLLYSMKELCLWEDEVRSVSEEQALLCWQIVERVKRHKGEIPDNIKM